MRTDTIMYNMRECTVIGMCVCVLIHTSSKCRTHTLTFSKHTVCESRFNELSCVVKIRYKIGKHTIYRICCSFALYFQSKFLHYESLFNSMFDNDFRTVFNQIHKTEFKKKSNFRSVIR